MLPARLPARLAVALLFALLLGPQLALAHHGWSSYDTGKPIAAEGTIEEIEIGNPHATMTITYAGRKWDVVLAPPSRLQARGATAGVVAKGKPVKVYAFPRRDGTAEMRAEWIEVDGRRFQLR